MPASTGGPGPFSQPGRSVRIDRASPETNLNQRAIREALYAALARAFADGGIGCLPPDGQLFVNLRGFDPGYPPLSPDEVLARFGVRLAPTRRICLPIPMSWRRCTGASSAAG
jgi:hypothetical protein